MTTADFLQSFFSSPNLFSFDHIGRDDHSAYRFIHTSVQFLQEENPRFTVLPYCMDKAGPFYWFGIAPNPEQAIDMKGLLNSFVGKTYADLRVNRPINTDRAVGRAVRDYVRDGYALLFEGDYKQITPVLKALYNFRDQRPPKPNKNYRSTGHLLRSFHYALANKDEAEATRLVQIMEARKFLDATNLIFLDVQIKASFQKWEHVRHHRYFSNLVAILRPRLVTLYLLQSVYETSIKQPYEAFVDAKGALRFFNEQVRPTIQPLLNTPLPAYTPELSKLYLLELLSQGKIEQRSWNQLSLQVGDWALSDPFWKALVAIKDNREKAEGVGAEKAHGSMMSAYKEENYALAKLLAISLPDSVDKALVLFTCALKTHDRESFNYWLEAKKALSPEDQALIQDKITKTLQLMSTPDRWIESEEALPKDWLTLLRRVNMDEEFARRQAVPLAEELALEGAPDQIREASYIDELVDALTASRSDVSEKVVRELLPHLLTTLFQSKLPDRGRKVLYCTLFELIVTTSQLNRGELVAINEVVELLLKEGIDSVQYRDILESILGITEYYHTSFTIACLLDFLDVVLQFKSEPTEELVRLLTDVKVFLEQVSKLQHVGEQWELFNSFCSYLKLDVLRGISSNEATEAQLNLWEFYRDKKIGIYTLSDNVARRAMAFMETLGINIKLSTSSAHVGSVALKDFAMNADVLIIVTGSAKHAATDFIKQHRQNRPILYPAGKGSSSILSALKDYATPRQ